LLEWIDDMEKIIQITSGRGPAECTWVVAQVLKKVLQEAKDFDLKALVLQHNAGQENGTIDTVTIQLEGKKADSFLNSWIGTIQWIGKSTFRKFHKRKNWYIGVFEIEKTKENTFSEKDIHYQALRSSGAGGQHVNKVSSAIRATHKPLGFSVVCMDSRSQHQNKKIATERLILKLKEATLNSFKDQEQSHWENKLQVERGNPVRIFEGSDFKRHKQDERFKKVRQKLKQQIRFDI
jgi:peptide chain release factor